MVLSDKRFLKRLLVALSIVVALVAVRSLLAPKRGVAHAITVPPPERPLVKAALVASTIDRAALLSRLASKRVLLVGEAHFQQEPQLWLQSLLGDLHDADHRSAVLLLELPPRTQPLIDRYLETGDEAALNEAFAGSSALPYRSTVRWVRAHPEAVRAVLADDESFWHIGFMRLLASDTRNETMARAIAGAFKEYPGQRIVAYGGRLHMEKAGRYMYDSETRRPVGARLASLGVPKEDLAAVWLHAGESPFDGAWDATGAVTFAGPAGDLPIAQIESEPIYGATRVGEIIDYSVHLGPATPIQDR